MSSTTREILAKKTYAVVTDEVSEPMRLGPAYNDFIAEIRVTRRTAGTITATIEHSFDKVNWYTFISFTAAINSVTSELKEPTAKALQYIRSKVTTAAGSDLDAEIYLNYRMIKG